MTKKLLALALFLPFFAIAQISPAPVTYPIPVSKGGTGQTTQSGAANAVLPPQTGQNGKFLATNGSAVSWEPVSSSGTSLSGLTAAIAPNLIDNTGAQMWRWSLVGDDVAMQIGESSPSTLGTGSQYIMQLGTFATSTASPFSVIAHGAPSFEIDPSGNSSFSKNANFIGSAQRITGDFSNATRSNRVLFQSSTTNGGTVVGAIPNGASTASRFVTYDNADPDNSAIGRFFNDGTVVGIDSLAAGTGTVHPIIMQISNVPYLEMFTTGRVFIGATPTDDGSSALNVNGTLKATTFSGAGTSLTGTAASLSIGGNAATATSAGKWTAARNLAGNSVDGSANVAFANKFIVQGTTDAGLSSAQFLGALGTGIVKNTTTTGVLSIATGADLPVMTSTVGGAVPTPPNNTTTYLRGDGTFAAISGFAASGANSDITSMSTVTSLSTAAGVSVHGTNTNNNASSGYVGEYVSSVVSSVAAPATTVYGDVTSISLTAGDWDVTGSCFEIASGLTATRVRCGISTNSGNSNTGLVNGDTLMEGSPPDAAKNASQTVANIRASLSGTTTYYLKMWADYSAGSLTFSGRISARRIR